MGKKGGSFGEKRGKFWGKKFFKAALQKASRGAIWLITFITFITFIGRTPHRPRKCGVL